MSNDVQGQGVVGGAAILAELPEPGARPVAIGEDAPALEAACDEALGGPAVLEPAEMRAWATFLRAHARVTRRLEAELLAESGMQLAEYDVLVQLAAADGRRLRMHELAERVVLSRAGVTRLVDRLLADGFVERAKCGADARGAYAVLTPAGLERLREAAPGHLAAVRRHFLDAFEAGELEELAGLLERLPPGR